ncbi:hypothetical protein [Cupriavidus sp. H18C1]|uniref:hypothetical protein n=1 Tax=Cupriavidus sp. H18C1 TaxID=3241601 RepID=UPI003BB8DA7D
MTMEQSIYLEAVEHILSAIYASGDRRLSSFLYGKPGAPDWSKRIRADIFIRRKDYIRALLFIRQNGASYLRAISIAKLWSLVTSFITENFWYISQGEFPLRHDLSYAKQVSTEGKIALAGVLKISAMFEPRSELNVYPLLPVRVAENFQGKHFFLLNAPDLLLSQCLPLEER